MAKTAMIRARMEPELKKEVEQILDALGLSMTDALTLFFKQVQRRRGLPFSVTLDPPQSYYEGVRNGDDHPQIREQSFVYSLSLDEQLEGLGPLTDEEMAVFEEIQADRARPWRSYDFFEEE